RFTPSNALIGTFIWRETPERSWTMAGTSLTSMRPAKRSDTQDGSFREALSIVTSAGPGAPPSNPLSPALSGGTRNDGLLGSRGISLTAKRPPVRWNGLRPAPRRARVAIALAHAS